MKMRRIIMCQKQPSARVNWAVTRNYDENDKESTCSDLYLSSYFFTCPCPGGECISYGKVDQPNTK